MNEATDDNVRVRSMLAEAIGAGKGQILMSCPHCYCPPLQFSGGYYCAVCGEIAPNVMVLFEPEERHNG